MDYIINSYIKFLSLLTTTDLIALGVAFVLCYAVGQLTEKDSSPSQKVLTFIGASGLAFAVFSASVPFLGAYYFSRPEPYPTPDFMFLVGVAYSVSAFVYLITYGDASIWEETSSSKSASEH